MPEIKHEIEWFEVAMQCDRCVENDVDKPGEMVVLSTIALRVAISTGMVTLPPVDMLWHKCTNADCECFILCSRAYPYNEHKRVEKDSLRPTLQSTEQIDAAVKDALATVGRYDESDYRLDNKNREVDDAELILGQRFYYGGDEEDSETQTNTSLLYDCANCDDMGSYCGHNHCTVCRYQIDSCEC